jgi:hypothetical protein
MAFQAGHYPNLEPSDSSPNQLATRVTLPFWEGRSLSSGEGLGTSLDEAMQIVKPQFHLRALARGQLMELSV